MSERADSAGRQNAITQASTKAGTRGPVGVGQPALVTVVIPAWRRADLLRRCLESLAEQDERRFRVLVVSNGGGQEVAATVQDFAGRLDCRLLELLENRGFAGGVNAGLAEAKTQYVAVLNDDVRLHPQWLHLLVDWLETHPQTGLCAGTILSGDGTRVDNLGDAVARSGAAWRLGHGVAVREPGGLTGRPLLAVSWTALLLRRELLSQLGSLDEKFISYLEDVDFAVRCVFAGVRADFLPQAMCWHQGSASSGGSLSRLVVRQMTRNQLLLLAKDFPARVLLANAPWIVWGQVLWFLMALRRGRPGAWLAGIGGFLRQLPGALASRLRWDAAAALRLRLWLRQGEAAIYNDQMQAGRGAPDTYWRWYFALACAPSVPPAAPPPGATVETPSHPTP